MIEAVPIALAVAENKNFDGSLLMIVTFVLVVVEAGAVIEMDTTF